MERNPNLAASLVIHNKNNVWIDDNMATSCHGCHIEFGFFKRKHHCRNCGNIFCYKCTNHAVVIPDFITDRPDPADYWNVSYYITSLKGIEEKVCKQCFDAIKNKIRAHEKIIQIINNPIPIDKIKELSESNTDVKTHYFDHLRNIQYYLPNHKYSDIDKKLLKINSVYFSRHSKYLVHLIKSMDWDRSNHDMNLQKLDFILSVLNGDKNKNCSDLYCTRTCCDEFSCDDCINILYSCSKHLPNELLQYLFDRIIATPEQVILCHLSFFITLIRENNNNKFLQLLLFKLLSQTKKIVYHTYWFLNNIVRTANMTEVININIFLSLFDKEEQKQMNLSYIFFAGLIDNLNDPKRYLSNNFDKYKPIIVPYDPDIQLISVDMDNISMKDSYTKPIVIPFQTNTGQIRLLFKKESVINDVTVLNLMTLCDIILQENLNIDFKVVVYPIMSLTASSGMIEIIENAETIYEIMHKKKTIFQYIIEKNEHRLVGDVMDRYMYSLVSYTLHSYFLGLGDRHLQNIMITNDGAIFHIDFGFILGTDAYPLTASDIKLNSSMLDVIGGAGSNRYNQYLELCSAGIIILRKYFNMFFILLSQTYKFSENHIEKFVLARFQPRQVDNIIITELMTVIKQSHNAYSDIIRDFLHYHTQEKTIQRGFSGIVKTAFNVMRNLTGSH